MKYAWFDLETTGLDVEKDRIVELAIVVSTETEVIDKKQWYINPNGRAIDPEASAVNGITEELVRDAPKFKDIAKEVYDIFMSADVIAGQNILGFDLKILYLEFMRAGIQFDLNAKQYYDNIVVERNIAPRNLGAMYKRYTGKELENAHQALVDTEACFEVFKHQSKKAVEVGLENNMIYSAAGIDIFGYVRMQGDKLVFNFGKNRGKAVVSDVDYAVWMLQSAFPTTTKQAIKDELRKAGHDVN